MQQNCGRGVAAQEVAQVLLVLLPQLLQDTSEGVGADLVLLKDLPAKLEDGVTVLPLGNILKRKNYIIFTAPAPPTGKRSSESAGLLDKTGKTRIQSDLTHIFKECRDSGSGALS